MIEKLFKMFPLMVCVGLLVWAFTELHSHLGKVYGDPTKVVDWGDVIGVPLSFLGIMTIGALAYKFLEDE